MNVFKRLSTTLSAKFDQAVSQVENHEAIVEAALKESRRALAKAQMRLSRVRRDGENLCQKLEHLKLMELTWVQRAKRVAQQDEQTALQCVQRRNLCRQQIVKSNEALDRHKQLEESIGLSVERMEQRLEELVQQRNQMQSRHTAADALRVIHQLEGGSDDCLEDTFDRWELLITETEYLAGSNKPCDSLDMSFSKLENEAALKAELDDLLDEAFSGNHKSSVEEKHYE